MRAPRWLFLGLAIPALLAARPPAREDADHLVRSGNRAFHAGALAEAARRYEQAEVRSLDPGLVAFNLATVRYHQARSGDLRALAAAEEGYRCCLEPSDPRRALALYGLGNCLLLRATAGRFLDAAALRAAIDRYTECLRTPECPAELAADARYNQTRARLLLLQAPPRTAPGEDPPAGEDASKEEPDDPRRQNDGKGEADGAGKPDRGSLAGPGGNEQPGARTEGAPAPGRGALPPVPEQPDAPPLGPREAAEHLERAARRILDDLAAHRRGRTRSASPGVRDW